MVIFKMDSEFVEEVENYVSYKLQSCKEYSIVDLVLTPCLVIADLGGLLGLFLGCSLISIVEMFYYLSGGFVGALFSCFCKSSSRKTPSDEVVSVSSNGSDLKDILDALNGLTITVNNMDITIKNNHREVNQKILNLDEKMLILVQKCASISVVV